ncbi:hypothetical protein [Solirubrum puertoriconensis]|nr:hypothetical protein [Solirubrum puertoriconensis]
MQKTKPRKPLQAPVYEANDAFARHLLDLGFTELATVKSAGNPRKRKFRYSDHRPYRTVHFDYETIRLVYARRMEWSGYLLPAAAFGFWMANLLDEQNRPAFERLAAL